MEKLRTGKILSRIIVPFIAMALWGVIGSVFQAFYGYNGLHVFVAWIWTICFLAAVLVVPLFIWFLVISLFPPARRTLQRAAPSLVTPLSIYLAMLSTVELFAYEATLPHLEYRKFVYEGADAKCVAAAADLGDGKKLGICRKLVFDNRLLAISDLDEAEIVFDSSDQITLPLQRRSSTWRATAVKVKLIDNSAWYQEPAKEREIFASVTPLGSHFYYLNLQYWAFDGGE
jgi:hypothetical protein